MRITYWVAECIGDSDCYNIRAKSKKEVVAQLADYPTHHYGKPHKVTVEFQNSFDLLRQCLSEGRIYEGVSE